MENEVFIGMVGRIRWASCGFARSMDWIALRMELEWPNTSIGLILAIRGLVLELFGLSPNRGLRTGFIIGMGCRLFVISFRGFSLWAFLDLSKIMILLLLPISLLSTGLISAARSALDSL